MMIASYTYVCTMHVKNGDKRMDGKLNYRSSIYQIYKNQSKSFSFLLPKKNYILKNGWPLVMSGLPGEEKLAQS